MQAVSNFPCKGDYCPTWAVVVPNGGTVDLTPYATSGELRFWANCNTDNFEALIQHSDGSQDGCSWAGTAGTTPGTFILNQWNAIV